MNEADYQSPIAPGRSWYEDSCGNRPQYPPLDGDVECDVVVIGGGFCGLSAALHLAEAGTTVVVLDQHRFGDGASGRNGGQLGSGQRGEIDDLEAELGFERSKALWDMAEDAKSNLLAIAKRYQFDPDYRVGQLTPMHKSRWERDAEKDVEHLRTHYGYEKISYLDRMQMSEALGSRRYFGGSRDMGTGHIHPMKYVIGLAAAAQKSGANLYENTKALSIRKNGKVMVNTPSGTITAERCLYAVNGYHNDVHPKLSSHVMPIQSFIASTVPLAADTDVIPNNEAVDDSRFVVRYFRKSHDNRLLFGGREAYGKSNSGDIFRQIRNQINEVYPQLAGVELTHAWGGNVAITMPRLPYIRELEPGVWTAGGFSGHGVMMSNYSGRLIAERFLGKSDQIRLLQDLKIRPFPGGKLLRHPLKILALTWFAMLDRL